MAKATGPGKIMGGGGLVHGGLKHMGALFGAIFANAGQRQAAEAEADTCPNAAFAAATGAAAAMLARTAVSRSMHDWSGTAQMG
jgi:hypothetical protein